MKSFTFGAAAALLAAYTVAEDPQHTASAERPYVASQMSAMAIGSPSRESLHRSHRGLPPFWGRKGVTAF